MAVNLPVSGEQPWAAKLNAAITGIDTRLTTVEGATGKPTIRIRTWPEKLPTTGVVRVIVNASDPDAQHLTYTLNASAGTLTPTFDPSVYILTL